MKKMCAKKALELIKDGDIVGLGGGSTVAFLIEEIEKSNLNIKAVTPSNDTMRLCLEHNITVLPLEFVNEVNIAFDGCDELDEQLNALKSCGGIHTREKIVASMANDYVLLGDETKLSEKLRFAYPVTIEVVKSARLYVQSELEKVGASVTWRRSDTKTGLAVTDDGNYLIDAKFKTVSSSKELAAILSNIVGIVEHSLFYNIATKAIITFQNQIRILENNK